MKVLDIHPKDPQKRLVEQVCSHLREGGILAFPTDTCYALGCSIFEKKAIDELYRIKRLPSQKPFSFICNDLKDISTYAHVSNRAYKLMRKLLPGPYTFVLPATRDVPKILRSKRKQVGIRVPDQPVILEVVRQLGHPLISTTCQAPGAEDACADITDIEDAFGTFVPLAIEGGYIYPDVSTVVAIEDEQIEIIREGKGPTDWFEDLI